MKTVEKINEVIHLREKSCNKELNCQSRQLEEAIELYNELMEKGWLKKKEPQVAVATATPPKKISYSRF